MNHNHVTIVVHDRTHALIATHFDENLQGCHLDRLKLKVCKGGVAMLLLL